METVSNSAWKRGKEYRITGMIICVFFLFLCAVKGVFPFGTNTLDTVDFESQWMPLYYRVWDVLHGRAALFFDWRVGGGNNFAGVSSQFTLISPFNLFFLLIPRGWIEKSLSFFILLKLVAMGSTMCFFLRNVSEQTAPLCFRVAGSVAYALSGYSFFYYGMGWLDTATFFPLLLYYFIRMVGREEEWKIGRYAVLYTLCYALIFVMNIPQAYMVSFYMVIFAGGYFFLLREKNTIQHRAILKFGLTTLLALGMSAVVFLPAALAILGSHRLSGEEFKGVEGYFYLLRQQSMDAEWKWLMLFGVLVPLAFFIGSCVCEVKNSRCESGHSNAAGRRKMVWQIYLATAMVLPVIVEAVNLLWHRGTYICFPMRYGYMMIFTVIFVALDRMAGETYKRSITSAVIGVWMVSLLVLGVGLIVPLSHDGEVNFEQDANEVGTVLAGKSDLFHKAKTADFSLNHNYPLISDTVSYSNYLHLMTTEQIMLNRALGYGQVWTRLGDTGGTLFSDALLGYTYTVDSKLSGQEELWDGSEELYQKIGETKHFRIFENRYGYGPGLKVKRNAYEAFYQSYAPNVFEHQNLLAQLFFGTDLIEIRSQDLSEMGKDGKMQCDIAVEGKKALYLYGNGIPGLQISVNGKKVAVPSYEEPEGMVYPSAVNTGMLALGVYDRENVEVILEKEPEGDAAGILYFGLLDIERFVQSTDAVGGDTVYEVGKNICRIRTASVGEEYLYLPVNADSGWHACVNGSEREIAALYGNLMLIPLDAGENDIVLTYVPKGMKKGTMVTVAAFVVLVIWAALSRIKRLDAGLSRIYGKLAYVAATLFLIGYLGFMIWLYVVPVGYTIFLKLTG